MKSSRTVHFSLKKHQNWPKNFSVSRNYTDAALERKSMATPAIVYQFLFGGCICRIASLRLLIDPIHYADKSAKEKGRKSETNDGKKPSACQISCVHRVPLRRKDNKQILKVCKKISSI
jgi:hypothetical protein